MLWSLAGFAQSGGLLSHRRSCLQRRGYLCETCGAKFNHGGTLRQHMILHTGEKPFVCSHCGAQFNDRTNFKRHKRIHENSFPYQCHHCEKQFRHSNSLKVGTPKSGKTSFSRFPSLQSRYIAFHCDISRSHQRICIQKHSGHHSKMLKLAKQKFRQSNPLLPLLSITRLFCITALHTVSLVAQPPIPLASFQLQYPYGCFIATISTFSCQNQDANLSHFHCFDSHCHHCRITF